MASNEAIQSEEKSVSSSGRTAGLTDYESEAQSSDSNNHLRPLPALNTIRSHRASKATKFKPSARKKKTEPNEFAKFEGKYSLCFTACCHVALHTLCCINIWSLLDDVFTDK